MSFFIHFRFYVMKNLKRDAKQHVTGMYEISCRPLQSSNVFDVLKLPSAYIIYPYSPYDGKWSKTMVGFGPEDDHFVAELTYNYGVGEYQLGNDFLVGESSLGNLAEAYNIFCHSGNISIVNRLCMLYIRGSPCSRARL